MRVALRRLPGGAQPLATSWPVMYGGGSCHNKLRIQTGASSYPMFPPARLGDPITHDKLVPCGVIVPMLPPPGPPTVLIEGMPAACMGDFVTCTGLTALGPMHPPQVGAPPVFLPPPPFMPIVSGKPNVLICGRPAAHWVTGTGGCGVFLGDDKMLVMRRVFLG